MSTRDDFTARCDQHSENLRQAANINKQLVFDALASAGITSVTAEFDGEGDSGGINGISAASGDMPVEIPDITVPVQEIDFGMETPCSRHLSLAAAIESLCYNYLEQKHGGWENDDGGYGTFVFNIGNRTIELEFNGRFTDVTTSTYEF